MERDAFTDERDRVLTRKELDKKWAWVLTGSGHFFNETIDLINKLNFVDLFVSKAAEEVLVMYKKKGKISREIKIYQDNSSSSASVGKFYKGAYHTLVMAPTSSNTVAKCVYGISDSLATNIFAQSGKCKVDCIFFHVIPHQNLKHLHLVVMLMCFQEK